LARKSEFILVGRLGRTRGVSGHIWITPLTDFPDRFLDLTEILVSHRETWERFEIESSQLVGGRPLVRFVGINNREEASRLTNRDLAVSADQLIELAPDTHYIFDIIGCEVVDYESKQTLGEVVDVRRYPANDVYLIKTDQGQEVLFPAVKDLVTKIDTQQKKIFVRSAGLFDGNDEKTEK